MDNKDVAEQAYKNGYEQGKADAAKAIFTKIYGFTAYEEVGIRYLIRAEAETWGVSLPKQPRKGLNGFEK